jgi:hypothetical protein
MQRQAAGTIGARKVAQVSNIDIFGFARLDAMSADMCCCNFTDRGGTWPADLADISTNMPSN